VGKREGADMTKSWNLKVVL